MTGGAARRWGGFSLFEFAVVCAVSGALVGVFLMRARFYQEEAEQVATMQMVATLRAALQMRATDWRNGQPKSDPARLLDDNPMSWLIEKPANYLGEYYSPPLEDLPHGNWVFDRRDKLLIYLPNNRKSFFFRASKFLKFKVEFVQASSQGATTSGAAESRPGLALVQLSDQSSANTD